MKKLLILLVALFFYGDSFAQKSQKPPQEIKSVYFQSWSAGQELGGSGTDFYIVFKKPLAKDILLLKLYFRNRVSKLEKASDTMYIARFHQRPELIIDENGNRNIIHKQPEKAITKYKLNDKEAVLEFVKTKKNRIYKFKNVEEKEFLAYPSAPPRN